MAEPALSHAREVALPTEQAPPATDPYRIVGEILEATRVFLDADATYVGEFKGSRQVFHWIAGDASAFGLRPGASLPITETLCHRAIAGAMPPLVNDTGEDPVAREAGITTRAGIRAYVSIPIFLPDGSLFGTLCAVNRRPAPARGPREENFAHTMSRILADQIVRIAADATLRKERTDRIRSAVRAAEAITIALQPVVSLRTRVVVGEEALTRFPDERPPAEWLNEVWNAGLGPDLELAAIQTALTMFPTLPRDVYLSVNASPATVLSPGFDGALEDVPLERIVLEITEHQPIEDYDALKQRVAPFRRKGMRLAIDDVCAGFAGLNHVVQLAPDVIKLDVSLIRGIEEDPARQALTSSLVAFANRTGASIVAEGIENDAQLSVLNVLGVGYGQGFLLGRPGNGVGSHVPIVDVRDRPFGIGATSNGQVRAGLR